MNKKFTGIIYLISFIVYYFIHMAFIANFISSFIFVQNQLLATLIMIVIIIVGSISIGNIILSIITYRKIKKIPKFVFESFRIMYVLMALMLLFIRNNAVPGEFMNLNIFTLFEFEGSNISFMVWCLNLLLFVPLKSFFNQFNLNRAIFLTFAIELLQLILGAGIFDLNDIILYVVGYLFGEMIYNRFKIKEYLV